MLTQAQAYKVLADFEYAVLADANKFRSGATDNERQLATVAYQHAKEKLIRLLTATPKQDTPS